MKLAIFDCDSTLSSIEGIDELGRLKGEATFAAVEQMTNDAMDGKIAMESIFARRLDLIQPSTAEIEKVGALYIETVEPTALETFAELRAQGWSIIIISGGFKQAIEPFANFLGIERVEAVPLEFDEEGNYSGYQEDYPTARSGGKPELIRSIKQTLSPEKVVMVGDGSSDLETMPEVDLFIGYGRYTERQKVKEGAEAYVYALSDILSLI